MKSRQNWRHWMRSPAESYGSIININKVRPPFVTPAEMVLQEKIDGSQFRFQLVLNSDGTNTLKMWSRGQKLNLAEPHGLFANAMLTVQSIQDKLMPGAVYIAEAVTSQKHNVIQYDRVPNGGLVLLDIYTNNGSEGGGFYYPGLVKRHAESLHLEVAPYYDSIAPGTVVDVPALINNTSTATSLLGGPVEGFVLKSLGNAVGPDGNSWKFKVINPNFSETKRKPKEKGDSLFATLGSDLASEVMWQKAMMRMAEQSQLSGTSNDIGLIIRAIHADIDKEYREAILLDVWAVVRKTVMSNAVRGLAEWYQGVLATQAQETEPVEDFLAGILELKKEECDAVARF